MFSKVSNLIKSSENRMKEANSGHRPERQKSILEIQKKIEVLKKRETKKRRNKEFISEGS